VTSTLKTNFVWKHYTLCISLTHCHIPPRENHHRSPYMKPYRHTTWCKPVSLGQGKVKRDLSPVPWTGHIPTLEAVPVPGTGSIPTLEACPCPGTGSIPTMEPVAVQPVPTCLIKWDDKAVELFLRILGILLHVNLGGGFSFNVSFSKRAVQMYVRNNGWPKIAMGDVRIHCTCPRKEHSKTEFGKKNSGEKFGGSRLLPGANLVLRPRYYHPTQYKYSKSCSKYFILQNLILRTRLCSTIFENRYGPGVIPCDSVDFGSFFF